MMAKENVLKLNIGGQTITLNMEQVTQLVTEALLKPDPLAKAKQLINDNLPTILTSRPSTDLEVSSAKVVNVVGADNSNFLVLIKGKRNGNNNREVYVIRSISVNADQTAISRVFSRTYFTERELKDVVAPLFQEKQE